MFASSVGMAAAGGKIFIPTFAVERAQELMYYIGGLVRGGRIPSMPVFLNSPMAVEVTDVFRRYKSSMDEEALEVMAAGGKLFGFDGMKLVRSKAESKAINRIKGPCIIMAGSGMCNAGRIKHHLATGISDPANTVVFVGYQANGTLGRHLVNGADEVRIHGAQRTVKARIKRVYGFSDHADRSELLKWLGGFDSQLRRVFLTHGEQEAGEALAGRIEDARDCPASIPEYGETVTLD